MVDRVLLVGTGAIARRYLGILGARWPSARVTLVRRPESRSSGEDLPDTVDRQTTDLGEALGDAPTFAIVAGPAPTHVASALVLAEAGIPMLIEKPLSDRLEGTGELVRRCRDRGVAVVVGYTLRYHPGVVALQRDVAAGVIGRVLTVHAEVGQYLPDWRPGTDYRTSVSARRATGGGALLELSHDLDLVRALLGMPQAVTGRLAHVSDLDLDVEDVADVILDHASGDRQLLATVHLDMVRRPAARTLTVAGTEGTIELDLVAGRSTRRSPDGTTHVEATPLEGGRDALHNAELDDLLATIDGGRPEVGLADGVETLRIIEAIRRSDAEGRSVRLDEVA